MKTGEGKSDKPGKFGFSKKLPFRHGHRRQFSVEEGLKPAMSVAVTLSMALSGIGGKAQ